MTIPAWELEKLRQEEHEGLSGADLDWNKIVDAHYLSHGYVKKNGEWVIDEPLSQRNWEGDGA